MDYLFYVFFFGVLGYFAYRMARYGGFKAAMFGARIDRTVGEIDAEKQGLVSVGVKIHVLRRDPDEKLVGVELVTRSFASYHMTPLTLSVSQAQQLVQLLNEAVRAV